MFKACTSNLYWFVLNIFFNKMERNLWWTPGHDTAFLIYCMCCPFYYILVLIVMLSLIIVVLFFACVVLLLYRCFTRYAIVISDIPS